MDEQLTDKVSFDFIRYANCWEDADILLQGLNPQPNSKILSIGSAGDNSFSLLITDPEMVVSVDVSKAQLYLIELKKACIQYFDYDELISFLGFQPSHNRDKRFHQIKIYLSNDAAKYWEKNIEQIKKGIISQGKFEKYFQLFSHKILPWIHSHKTVEELLHNKSAGEQKSFYQTYWNNRRWRLLFKIFFSKYIMGKYGRDPEFMKEVKMNVGDFIFNKAATHLQSIHAQNNFILRYNLTGSFGSLMPHYLQPQNIDKIKANLDKLYIKEGYAEKAVQEFGKFNYMNLSNIFEYMNPGSFANTSNQLISAAEPGGKLAYWNLMVPRRISEIFPDKMMYEKKLSETLSEIDKGFFYDRFVVDTII
jgi:S-adenosylmethionine-diacylglycerol 3-amino-3-carboxypropyl transferase